MIKLSTLLMPALGGIIGMVIVFLLGNAYAPNANDAMAYGWTLTGATTGAVIGYLLSLTTPRRDD